MLNAKQFYAHSEPVQLRWPNLPVWLYLTLVVILALVSIGLAQLIGGLAMNYLLGINIIADDISQLANPFAFTMLLLFSFLPVFLFVHWSLKLLEGRGISTLGLQLSGHTGKEFAIGLGLGLLLFVTVIATMLIPGYAQEENPMGGTTAILGALMILFGFLIQGAAEEVLIRGFILQIFGRMTSTWFAILFSSALFAFIHGANDSIHILPLINLFLFSVFAALYTLARANLWGICAIHGIWNWAQGNLFGLQVSGHDLDTAIIIDLHETGPDMITGGGFGPEGGLVVSAVFSLGIIWFVFKTLKQRQSNEPS